MDLLFHDNGWEDYLYWQQVDKKMVRRTNALIKEMRRTPEKGAGKPQRLKHGMSGMWSRRIDQEHRLVYTFSKTTLTIIACRYHY
ncbi:MAG: Txe/YoeB family addiction module toxin [Magnetococcales bacterium]|nr:Txe/YoeB family addiction module toxin [Magnetococcales bacterium]